jgi:acyl dehydratase
MALNPDVVGLTTTAHELPYDWKTAVVYALGIGAKRDELPYLYEGNGPKVYPTMAVVPAYAPLMELLLRTGGDLSTMVHGAQSIRMHGPIPASGVFRTVGSIDGIYDMKRLGQVVCTTRTEISGALICETQWSLLFRGEGGIGARPPTRTRAPKPPDDAEPDFTFEDPTLPEQALLYRLSGDDNPLHADPEFAAAVGFDHGPILHGLATFGFIARAIILCACGGDGNRLEYLTPQFRKPVWPGETIVTEGHRVGDVIVAKVRAGGRDDAVVTDCFAEIA